MVKEYVPNESKRQRFQRLATKRTKRVIEAIRVLGHCSNENVYNYSQEDVEKMFKAINKEIKLVKMTFEKNNKYDFSL